MWPKQQQQKHWIFLMPVDPNLFGPHVTPSWDVVGSFIYYLSQEFTHTLSPLSRDLDVSWMRTCHDQCSKQCKQSQILGSRSKAGLGGGGGHEGERWLANLAWTFLYCGENHAPKLPGFSKSWFTHLKCQENDFFKWVGRVGSPEPGGEFSNESQATAVIQSGPVRNRSYNTRYKSLSSTNWVSCLGVFCHLLSFFIG